MKSVHFVCRGNVYRSRLAEAYAASILGKMIEAKISSSGIQAELALNGDIDPETVRLINLEKLQDYLTPKWRQTTQNDIDKNDLVIFMSQTLYKEACQLFNVSSEKARIWDIQDVDGVYPNIKNCVNELVEKEF